MSVNLLSFRLLSIVLLHAVILHRSIVLSQVELPSGRKVIEWVQVATNQLFQYPFEASGIGADKTGKRHIYLVRANHSNRWVPGKLIITDLISATVADGGAEHVYHTFQVLTAPTGTLSWIPMPLDGSVPANAVVGGTGQAGRTQYVCRAWYNDDLLIVGKYANYHKKCYIGAVGKEHSRDTGEVLVMNAFGIASGVSLQ